MGFNPDSYGSTRAMWYRMAAALNDSEHVKGPSHEQREREAFVERDGATGARHPDCKNGGNFDYGTYIGCKYHRQCY